MFDEIYFLIVYILLNTSSVTSFLRATFPSRGRLNEDFRFQIVDFRRGKFKIIRSKIYSLLSTV